MTVHTEAVKDKIDADYQVALKELPEHLAEWLRKHRISIRPINVSQNTNGTNIREYLLLTDHTCHEDSSYRIIYDRETKQYGAECTLDTGVQYLIGFYGSLAETINEM